jgi:MATE family multidrug resistance protein
MNNNIRTESTALWQLAWPVLIGQLATVGMSVADVTMIGHLSAEDLAAVALGASLWVITMVTVMGIMIAINAVVAFEVGTADLTRIPHIMRQSMWMAFGVGILACLVLNFSTGLFNYLHIEPQVQAKAKLFVHVISIGLPAFAMYRALYSYTTSLNQTKPVMIIALCALGFNIIVNWFLIYGHWGMPQLGSTGCAVATGISMWLMLGAMLWWVGYSPIYRQSYPFTHFEAPKFSKIFSMLRMGLPIGITYFVEVSAFCLVGLLVARFGVVQIASNQIALNFSSFLFMVPMSLGMALITRVGQTLGEGNLQKARFVSMFGVCFSLAFALCSASFMAIFRHQIASIYTSDPAVQEMTASLLLIAAIFQFSDGVQVTASCAIRGYKVTLPPMLIHVIAFYCLALPLGYILGLAPTWMPWHPKEPMGATGFWIGLTLGLTVSAVLQIAYLQYLSLKKIKSSN